jgi:hypothetical protein
VVTVLHQQLAIRVAILCLQQLLALVAVMVHELETTPANRVAQVGRAVALVQRLVLPAVVVVLQIKVLLVAITTMF